MDKIIFIDVDGTLCHGDFKVSEENKEILDNSQYHYVLCSGRTTKELSTLGLNIDMIGSNGGEVIKNGEIIFTSSLAKETVLKLIKLFDRSNILVEVHTDDDKYIADNDYHQLFFDLANKYEFGSNDIQKRIKFLYDHNYDLAIKVQDLREFVKCTKQKIKKVEVSYVGEKTKEITTLINDYGVNAFSSLPINIEIVPEGVSKKRAIEHYLEKETSKSFAIGDGDNDIPMFEIVDYAIAMGNASENLKNIADFITDDISNKGFVNAIKHIDKLK